MSLPTGVAKRGDIYHLQIKVPLKLQAILGRVFWIRKSLGTGDKPTAAVLAHRQWAEATAAFAAAEAKLKPRETVPLTPAMATHIVEQAEHHPLAFDGAVRFDSGVLASFLRSIEPPPQRFFSTPEDGPLPESDYWNSSPDGSLTLAQSERLRALAQLNVDDLGAAVSMGRLTAAREFAEAICASMGVLVDWSLPANRPTLVAVLHALLVAWIGAADRGAGKPVATPPRPEAPMTAQAPRVTKGKTLTDVFDVWKVGKKPDAVGKMTRALATLKESKQDAPLRELTRQHALAFRDFINAKMAGAAGKTRSDVLANVQALLNFAVKEKGWLDLNPWAGTSIAKGRAKKRDPWDDETLQKLLNAALTEDHRIDLTAQYWLPLLALMTGARQAELCQLRVDDVIKRDGVWLIDINEDTEDKSVKSAAGVRLVAIHSKLIELGFIDMVESARSAGHTLLFSGIKSMPSRAPSLYVSDWFRTHCRTLGIYQRYRDFHALRTTVGTALRAVDPPHGEALITAVMGHEAGNVGAANYHQPAPKTLQRVIESLDFPAVLALPRVFKVS
jgi:integrase